MFEEQKELDRVITDITEKLQPLIYFILNLLDYHFKDDVQKIKIHTLHLLHQKVLRIQERINNELDDVNNVTEEFEKINNQVKEWLQQATYKDRADLGYDPDKVVFILKLYNSTEELLLDYYDMEKEKVERVKHNLRKSKYIRLDLLYELSPKHAAIIYTPLKPTVDIYQTVDQCLSDLRKY